MRPAACVSAFVSSASGAFASRLRTSSIETIAPSPRTSPMQGSRTCIALSRVTMRSPMLARTLQQILLANHVENRETRGAPERRACKCTTQALRAAAHP